MSRVGTSWSVGSKTCQAAFMIAVGLIAAAAGVRGALFIAGLLCMASLPWRKEHVSTGDVPASTTEAVPPPVTESHPVHPEVFVVDESGLFRQEDGDVVDEAVGQDAVDGMSADDQVGAEHGTAVMGLGGVSPGAERLVMVVLREAWQREAAAHSRSEIETLWWGP
ncbi:hypothetical protein [Streptomyces sp. Y2F8-2]|uniref:hypothetical protein n=1 Tax=Streptomyces sp. Y2F8-2 TaxID=2759675 RepID=UPI001F2F9F2B|nr:hypothetical protein [Streptomyces sp. Y2F8-2]